jgi:hypothetical protein
MLNILKKTYQSYITWCNNNATSHMHWIITYVNYTWNGISHMQWIITGVNCMIGKLFTWWQNTLQ